ncbi:unnamed protein product [Closterium sp. Naga37s-1]|nr:unnamed protein product [Closterium sp. Naga37s-1]
MGAGHNSSPLPFPLRLSILPHSDSAPTFKIQGNYLTGSMPAALPASLKYLDASGNYLVRKWLNKGEEGGHVCKKALHECLPPAALLSVKASLGVSFTSWAVSSPCAVEGVAAPPGAWSNVLCNSAFKPVSLSVTRLPVSHPSPCQSPVSRKLSGQKLAGKMHSDISKLSTLTSVDFSSNLLQGRLDAFTTDFKALTSLKQATSHIRSHIFTTFPFISAWTPTPTCPPLAILNFNQPQLGLALQQFRLAHGSNFNFNWFAGSIPSALVGITSLTSFGASYNYLYGPVPKLGTALKTIDLQKNWLSGTFPGTGFLSCSASSNCFANSGACNTTGTTQRPLASCAVCDSPTGADPICAGGTCAPNTAGPLASSTTPTTSSPILPRFCVGVPLNAVQAAILLSVKTALGVTFTEWSASTLAVAPKAKPLVRESRNGLKAMGRRRLAESEAGRERVLLVAPPSPLGQAGLCTIQGQTPVPGSWPGVFCSSAGMVVGLTTLPSKFSLYLCCSLRPCCPLCPFCSLCLCALPASAAPSAPAVPRHGPLSVVGRDLRSDLLRGTVHADISKLTTLTALYLSSNLFYQRLDSFVAPILPTASLKELAVSFNWLYGSVPSKLLTMAALSNLTHGRAPTFSSFPSASATAGTHAPAPTCTSFFSTFAAAVTYAPAPTCTSFFSTFAAAVTYAPAPTCSSFFSTFAAAVTHAPAPTCSSLFSTFAAAVTYAPAPTCTSFFSTFAAAVTYAPAPTCTSFFSTFAAAVTYAPAPTCTSFFSTFAAAVTHAPAPTCSSLFSTFAAAVTHAPAPTCSCFFSTFAAAVTYAPAPTCTSFFSTFAAAVTYAPAPICSFFPSAPAATSPHAPAPFFSSFSSPSAAALAPTSSSFPSVPAASGSSAHAPTFSFFPTKSGSRCSSLCAADFFSVLPHSPAACLSDSDSFSAPPRKPLFPRLLPPIAFPSSQANIPGIAFLASSFPAAAGPLSQETLSVLPAFSSAPLSFQSCFSLTPAPGFRRPSCLPLYPSLPSKFDPFSFLPRWHQSSPCSCSSLALSVLPSGDLSPLLYCSSSLHFSFSFSSSHGSGDRRAPITIRLLLSVSGCGSGDPSSPRMRPVARSFSLLLRRLAPLPRTSPGARSSSALLPWRLAPLPCLSSAERSASASPRRLAPFPRISPSDPSASALPQRLAPFPRNSPSDPSASALPQRLAPFPRISPSDPSASALPQRLAPFPRTSSVERLDPVAFPHSSRFSPRCISPPSRMSSGKRSAPASLGSSSAVSSPSASFANISESGSLLDGWGPGADLVCRPSSPSPRRPSLVAIRSTRSASLLGERPGDLPRSFERILRGGGNSRRDSSITHPPPCYHSYLIFSLPFSHLSSLLFPPRPPAIPTTSRFSYNYLTGTLPKPGATLKGLSTQANFLSGTFPTATLAACNARLNCFTDASGCFNLDGTEQRTAAECSMCGSLTKKQQTLCGGGICLPIISPSLAKVPNSASAPILPMTCAAVPLDATSALLSIGAALGVRDTDWRNGSKCNIEGQTANPKSFLGVWCNANGTVLSIDLSYNLFSGQLSKFVSNMLPLTTMATLRLGANYLTGTLPAMATQLQVLAIASNLLAGAFPTQPFQLCDIRSNCLSSPGSCANDAGVAQRTSGCAFCGSATGAPPFCAGTACTPDVAARLAAGTVNTPAAALLAMFCQAVPVDDNSGEWGFISLRDS